MNNTPTKKYLQENVIVDEVSKNKAGNFIFREGFFYTHGRTANSHADSIQKQLTDLGFKNFKFVDTGEHWREFKGGASLRTQSHWYVEVKFDAEEPDVTAPVKVGDKLYSWDGKIGTVKKIHALGDMADVDFGNGNIYGIAFSRIKGSKVGK